MESIGFDYFRRFEHFPDINLGNITLLVGSNNSGKSTLIKAILLCCDNLRLIKTSTFDDPFNMQGYRFCFDANEWHDVKIKTFARAIYGKMIKSINENGKEINDFAKHIKFRFSINEFKFEIIVEQIFDVEDIPLKNIEDERDIIYGNISYVSIKDCNHGLQFIENFNTGKMSYKLFDNPIERTRLDDLCNEYRQLLATYKKTVNNDNESCDKYKIEKHLDLLAHSIYYKITNRNQVLLDTLPGINIKSEEWIDDLKRLTNYDEKNTYEYESCEFPCEHYLETANENLFEHIIGNFVRYSQENNRNGEKDETRERLYKVASHISASKRHLRDLINSIRIEYISIHSVNQNNIYNIEDKNDYIAKVIHAYYNSGIKRGDEIDVWIKDWISNKKERFNIGNDFQILRLGDSAYQFRIFEDDDIHFLADKGMGTIQVMILLLRLATIIKNNNLNRKFEYEGNSIKNGLNIKVEKAIVPTIIIEEPEQNLHPKMQSVLALFFKDAYERFGCKFIIETHSEYLIRKSQVLVKKISQDRNIDSKEDLEKINPFKVYYFDGNNEAEPYYEMKYGTNGLFNRKFGEGFIDMSSKLLMDLL